MIAPSIRKPPFANAENARAISSGLTACAPSPIEKYDFSGLAIPSLCAVFTMFAGPTSRVSCAYTVLSEWMVAVVRSIDPRFSPS